MMLNQLLTLFNNYLIPWHHFLAQVGLFYWAGLALLEFVGVGWRIVLGGETHGLAIVARKVVITGVVNALINLDIPVGALLMAGETYGYRLAAATAHSADNFTDLAVRMLAVLGHYDDLGLLEFVAAPASAILLLGATVLTALAFVGIGLRVALLYGKSILLFSVAGLAFAFGVCRATASITDAYITSLIHTAFSLMITLGLAGIMVPLSESVVASLTNPATPLAGALAASAYATVLLLLMWTSGSLLQGGQVTIFASLHQP